MQVKIIAHDGTFVTLRAQEPEVNLITENPVLLRLPRNKLSATILGVGSVTDEYNGQAGYKML